jgi:hypothetical protein
VLTRQTLAQQTVLGQLSEQAITAFLNSTGGLFCSFADVTCPPPGQVMDTTGVASGWRYIETMYRMRWTDGCTPQDSAQRMFCPSTSANVLGVVGGFAVQAVNRELPFAPLGELFVSNSASFSVVAPTPTPLPAPAVPTLSAGGWIGLLVLLALAGIAVLRSRHGS